MEVGLLDNIYEHCGNHDVIMKIYLDPKRHLIL